MTKATPQHLFEKEFLLTHESNLNPATSVVKLFVVEKSNGEGDYYHIKNPFQSDSKCKFCGFPIKFGIKYGKYYPLDYDLEESEHFRGPCFYSHFLSCKKNQSGQQKKHHKK